MSHQNTTTINTANQENAKIKQCQLSLEVKYSYLSYAISTNESRSLPDVRDGLKPCQRRIVYSMYETGCSPSKPVKKCSKVIGDVLGSYHPHGDVAVYDTIVRMTQKFNTRYPLTEGQGNFGSMDGDGAAAMRYTGIKLSPYSSLLTDDLDFDTVPVCPNYDDSKTEPKVLPASVPTLILNGSSGIAVGMCTGIPPHNFIEVAKALIAYTENPNMDVEEILQYIQGPDFPNGATVINKNDLLSIYTSGTGAIKVRGTYKQEEDAIIIDSIPYKINKANLLQQIMEAVKKYWIKGVEKIWDESNNKKIRIVIRINQLCSVDFLMKMLYKYTQLQSNFNCNFIALEGKRPALMGLSDMFKYFLRARMDVIRRRYSFLLKKTRKQQEHTFAILVVLDNLEEIIHIIRNSAGRKEAIDLLMCKNWKCEKITQYVNNEFLAYIDLNNYSFTLEQCEYILGIRLQQLTQMEYQEVVKQMLKNYDNINYYISIVNSEEAIKAKIIEETTALLEKKWPDIERKTKIDQILEDGEICAPNEEVIVIVDNQDYIKRMPLSSYRTQHRGGIGKNVLDSDLKLALITNTREKVLFVSLRSDGLCSAYPIEVYHIKEFIGSKAKGQHINSIINDDQKHQIKTMFNPSALNIDYLIFVTAKGTVRKNDIAMFKSVRRNGKQVMKIEADDNIAEVLRVKEKDLIIMASKMGNVIVFHEDELRCFASNYSKGVRGMKLKKNDQVIKAAVAQEDLMLLTITAMGYGKTTNLKEYRITKRGGTGVKLCKLQKKDEIIGAYLCKGDEELIIGTKTGNIFRTSCNEIRKMHKNTKGVQICKFKNEEDRVVFANIVQVTVEEDIKELII